MTDEQLLMESIRKDVNHKRHIEMRKELLRLMDEYYLLWLNEDPSDESTQAFINNIKDLKEKYHKTFKREEDE